MEKRKVAIQVKKKLLSLLLAVAMVMSLALPALADNDVLIAPAPSDGITILYSNDVHTYIDKDVTYSKVAALKKSLGEGTLLVDAGDHIQGTAYGSMDKGETIIKLMNAAGYDLATLGNHEFDYGMDGCMNAIKWASFPYVSCNFYHEKNGTAGESVLDSYKVFEVGGKKIAFVGITTPESFTKSTPAYFQDGKGNYIYGIAGGKDGAELYAAVQKAIDAAAKEADYVIALGHLGDDPASDPWNSEDVIEHTTGLLAFIDGHSHSTVEGKQVKDKAGKTVMLTQTGSYFAALGRMTIAKDGTVTTKLLHGEDLKDLEADADVKAIEDAWMTKIDNQLGEKIGSISDTLDNYDADGNRLVRKQETNSGDFAADALYHLFDNMDMDVDLAVMNGGGVRNGAITGDITYKTCKEIHTFGNVACLIKVTGQQVLDALEWGAKDANAEGTRENGGFLQVSGIKYTINTAVPSTVQKNEKNVWVGGPTGQYRVSNVEVLNRKTGKYEPLKLDAHYNMAGYNYTLRNLGDGFAMFSGAENVLDYVMEDYMVVANYVKSFSGGKVTGYAKSAGRITIVNDPTKVDFTDVSADAWYYAAVKYVQEQKIMNGTGAGVFSPDESVNRAMLMTMLARLSGKDTTGGETWYEKAVAWAVEDGISDGTNPTGPITRQEVVTMLWRYAGKPESKAGLSAYPDAGDVADWAQQAMQWAVEQGVIKGSDGKLLPGGTAIRAEIAQIFMNFSKTLKG